MRRVIPGGEFGGDTDLAQLGLLPENTDHIVSPMALCGGSGPRSAPFRQKRKLESWTNTGPSDYQQGIWIRVGCNVL